MPELCNWQQACSAVRGLIHAMAQFVALTLHHLQPSHCRTVRVQCPQPLLHPAQQVRVLHLRAHTCTRLHLSPRGLLCRHMPPAVALGFCAASTRACAVPGPVCDCRASSVADGPSESDQRLLLGGVRIWARGFAIQPRQPVLLSLSSSADLVLVLSAGFGLVCWLCARTQSPRGCCQPDKSHCT